MKTPKPLAAAAIALAAVTAQGAETEAVKAPERYLWPSDYMADPAAHVFQGKIYLYPSHDWDSPVTDKAEGNHYDMRD
ncbi:MAG: hypothetical protein K2O33_06970, partial [Muribaculaceae bacterium]|nr:hypothetical protein [Muribaculaceae bacterium]